MLDIAEQKDNRILIEDEFQEDYTPEHKQTIPLDNPAIILDTNKHSIVLRTLHNLSHRSIHNQRKELIEVG
jgi:hypothetical protein